MIPASTSLSRSLTALFYTGKPSLRAGQWHALAMIAVGVSGYLWLPWVPMAVLMGALLITGVRMIPPPLWGLLKAREGRGARLQAWVVALVFVGSSGALALLAGLLVATLDLLRASGEHAIRRIRCKANCVRATCVGRRMKAGWRHAWPRWRCLSCKASSPLGLQPTWWSRCAPI